jgi:membrane fusion protein (multidrug efflux system)
MATAQALEPASNEAAAEARPAPAAKKNRARPYLIFGAIVAAGAVGYVAFRSLTAGKESTDDAQISVDMVPVAARVGGALLAVPVSDNQAVKTGDLLAQIDPSDYENKVKQADAELRAAKAQAAAADAQMRIVEASSRGGLSTARAQLSGSASSAAGADAQIAAAEAMVAKARADADKADNDLRRAQSLRKDDAIPQAQVDNLTSQAAAMRAAVAQAQANLAAAGEARNSARTRIAEAAGRVEQSAPVDAQVAVAKANADLAAARAASAEVALAQALLNLSYTKVLAPRDGHISRLAVHAGQLVQPSQTITNVLPDTTYVVANFKETQVGAMKIGQSAEVVLDAFPGRKLSAKVESLAFGTGAQFSMLPPDNASGNFVKVVQRVPVKLTWVDLPGDVHPQAGLSADVTVRVK